MDFSLSFCIGTFGPGVTLITMSFLDCHLKYVVVTLFTVGLMMNSGVFSGGLLNPIEISPRHAGFIFAGSNSLSAATGFIGPIVVSALTPHVSEIDLSYFDFNDCLFSRLTAICCERELSVPMQMVFCV